MLKIRSHFFSAVFLLTFSLGLLAVPVVVRAQSQELTLGTYDEDTKIFNCPDGNFQISFPVQPPEEEIISETTGNEASQSVRGIISTATGFKFTEIKTIRISGEEGVMGISYAKVAKLEAAGIQEQRDVAERFFGVMKSLIGDEKTKIRKRQEVKVPGTSFGVDFVAAKDGSTAEARFRILISKDVLYSIFLFGQSERMSLPEAAGFTDSFKLLGVSDNGTPQKPAKNSTGSVSSLTSFTFAKDGFRIGFPAKPEETESESKTESGVSFVQTRYAVETAEGAYMVSVQESSLDPVSSPDAVKLAFDNTGPGLAKVFSGKVLSENDVVISRGLRGRELQVSTSSPPGIYRTRIFFANTRFYQLIALGTPDFANSAETDEFFGSFRLLESGTRPSPDSSLMEYTSALGEFNAQVPFKPVYSRRTQTDADGREHIQHLYLCDGEERGTGTVLISVTEFDGLCQNSDTQLHTMCESFVRGMAGKNQVKQFARVNSDVNSHEWTFQHTTPDAGVNILGRVVIANDRFYIVQAIGDHEFLADSSTQEIIRSLGVMAQASKE